MNPDVVVVGAGPAGISAALALDAAGAGVRIVDEQPRPAARFIVRWSRFRATAPRAWRCTATITRAASNS